MRVLPAIDLKNGQCVRLKKGDYDTAFKVAEDAVSTAKSFYEAGATMIHMVDLDGAKDGVNQNYEVVRRVIQTGVCQIELGGGIRTMENLDAVMALGVARAVLGSAAVGNPDFVKAAVEKYGEKVAVGIDTLYGTVRTQGWLHDTGTDYISFAKEMEALGVHTLIFTDIDKDGMLNGPNFAQLELLRKTVGCKIVASGGVSTVTDIRRLKKLGIDEAIAGRAVYTGTLDLAAAIKEGA